MWRSLRTDFGHMKATADEILNAVLHARKLLLDPVNVASQTELSIVVGLKEFRNGERRVLTYTQSATPAIAGAIFQRSILIDKMRNLTSHTADAIFMDKGQVSGWERLDTDRIARHSGNDKVTVPPVVDFLLVYDNGNDEHLCDHCVLL
eukprot:GHVU01017395.1.p1 GENE.GHVU01017395.1~~GHVU01017395.1.p1  ORF type:complete len:149 (+),score=4.24 GHVU01017395.1:1100-1546(+)